MITPVVLYVQENNNERMYSMHMYGYTPRNEHIIARVVQRYSDAVRVYLSIDDVIISGDMHLGATDMGYTQAIAWVHATILDLLNLRVVEVKR